MNRRSIEICTILKIYLKRDNVVYSKTLLLVEYIDSDIIVIMFDFLFMIL